MLSVGKEAVFLKMKSVSKRQFSVRPESTLGHVLFILNSDT